MMNEDSPVDERPPNIRRMWLRRVLEVILFFVLWVPIVLSAIHNIQEQTGRGHDQPWDSIGATLRGWGLWLAGVFIWYVLVSGIGRFILKKLGLIGRAEE